MVLLKNLNQASPRLERLVLYIRRTDPKKSSAAANNELEDFLLTFVSEMKHLVVLCLVGVDMNPGSIELVKRRLIEEVIPIRPSFWFYFGEKLPEGFDPEVPPIHYDEIVYPPDWSHSAPPSF